MAKSLTKSYTQKKYVREAIGTTGRYPKLNEISSLDSEIPTEAAIKSALKMYDSDSYTITVITQKTGVSKTALYQALGMRSIESLDSEETFEK